MKRTLSLVLAVVLVLSLFSVTALSAVADELPPADGTTADSNGGAESGDPTPAATQITSAEEFAAITGDGSYVLANDITVSATVANAFTGTLDGNGKTVTTTVPLFDTLTGATVKNLTIAGEITGQTGHVGALSINGSALTVENVVNNANITSAAAGKYIGGIVGAMSTGKGTKDAHEYSYFTNCVNNGNLTVNVFGAPRMGGIVGNAAKYQHCVYTGCVNNGKVSYTGAGDSGAPYVAGIAGSSFGAEFVNCVNNGDLYSNLGADMGGILGRGTPSSQKTNQSTTITGCVNNGNLTVEGAKANRAAGGMMGYCGVAMEGAAYAVYTVENCYNFGNVTGNSKHIAGLIGYIYGQSGATNYSYGVAKNSYNFGTIKGTDAVTFASQFIAYCNSTLNVLENCYGFGTVETVTPELSVIMGLSSCAYTSVTATNVHVAANGANYFSYATDEKNAANRVTIADYMANTENVGKVVDIVVEVSDEAELIEAVKSSCIVSLKNDITLTAALAVTGGTIVINGNGYSLLGGKTVTFTAPSGYVTVNNLKIAGNVSTVKATADTVATLNMNNVEINAASGVGVTLEVYWNLNLDSCTVVAAKSHGVQGKGYNTMNVNKCEVNAGASNKGYGVYLDLNSTGTITDTTVTSKGYACVQMKTGTSKEDGTSVVIKNCTMTATTAYAVAVNPYGSVEIDGGTYSASGADACINVNNGYGKIMSGSFTCSQNCAARAYTGEGTLDIYGGEFYFTPENTSSGGSALRAGTGKAGGTINIYGGTFSTTAAGPVVNGVHADGKVNIVAGTFINAGENDIAVYDNTVVTNFEGKITFAEGQKTHTVGEVTPGGDETTVAPGGDETTATPGGDETTATPGGDETTATPGGDETTATPGGDETTATPDDGETTATPSGDSTTKAPDNGAEGGCEGCGGFAAAAQAIAVLVGVVGVAIVVKRK